MTFELIPLAKERETEFKRNMQEAFQYGAFAENAEQQEEVLPEEHIDQSLAAKGSAAYEALADGLAVGGAVVVIDEQTQHNHLDFLFVKVGVQSRGLGQAIWKALEDRYPATKKWETCTPYFDKRNIHFYINKCGFHAVEFYSGYHPDPHDPDGEKQADDGTPDEMFRFEKEMGPDCSPAGEQ